jgi:hypothetical protein
MEAPAGLAFRLSLPYSGGPGLIQPAGLARPQPGLMEIDHLFRSTALAVGLMEIEN